MFKKKGKLIITLKPNLIYNDDDLGREEERLSKKLNMDVAIIRFNIEKVNVVE